MTRYAIAPARRTSQSRHACRPEEAPSPAAPPTNSATGFLKIRHETELAAPNAGSPAG